MVNSNLMLLLMACALQCAFVACRGITEVVVPQPTLLANGGMSKSCCASVNAEWPELMNCVNTTALEHENKLRNKAKIGFVTFATRDIWDYTVYSYGINQIYAEQHGYLFRHMDEKSDGSGSLDPRDSRWNKVKILEEALDTWGKALDYVVWVDADIVVMDMGLSIEEVAAMHPQAHLLSSAEHAGSSTLINSGMLIAKNSPFARMFLRAWWEYGERSLFSDQEQFDLLYKHCQDRWTYRNSKDTNQHHSGDDRVDLELFQLKPFDITKYIAILPPDALNSDPPAMTQQRPHNQILHLMGEHTAYRAKVFKEGLRELCETLHSVTLNGKKRVLALQLGLSQMNLLHWTVEIYGDEASELLRLYSLGAPHGKFGIKESRRLSNSVHHYSHAVDNSVVGSNPIDVTTKLRNVTQFSTTELRVQVWRLLLNNIDARREINKVNEANTIQIDGTGVNTKRSKVSEDWPELLKVAAEAGQQLIGIHKLPFGDRKNIADTVMNLLEEILQVCHEQQRPAVLHMVAHIHAETGLLVLHEQQQQQLQGHESLHHFHKSLQIYRDLSINTGRHILVQPLTSLANALCTQKYFIQAFPVYEEAIRIAETVLGSKHESLAGHYLNFGISKVQAGHYIEAAVLLRKSIYIFDTNVDANGDANARIRSRDSEAYKRAEAFLQMAINNEGVI